MSGRSTTTNLSLFTQYVSNALESGFQVDVIYTDFRKAFDSICIPLLIQKLKRFGFHSNFLKWISSYLFDRRQVVKILNSLSSKIIYVKSGVPQGSHLGPILFLIFINELPLTLKFTKGLLFADDLKIFSSVKSMNDCFLIQNDIHAINDWCKFNYLTLNIKKCKFISFSRSNTTIIHNYSISNIVLDRVSEVKDLGVIFNEKLNFAAHIDYAIAKANSMLGFLKRNCSEFSNPYAIKSVYMSLVRTHLEYASVVWDPHYAVSKNRIEKVQKSFTKFVVRQLKWNLNLMPGYSTRCALIGLNFLENRRLVSDVMFVHDILSYHIKCPDLLNLLNLYVPQRNIRSRQLFYITYHRFNYGFNEPFSRCMKLYNEFILYLDISLERNVFKKNLIDKLISF